MMAKTIPVTVIADSDGRIAAAELPTEEKSSSHRFFSDVQIHPNGEVVLPKVDITKVRRDKE